MYISNLADLVTEGMLEGTFSQIGQVLGAGVERAGCGWVELKNAEDALEVVQSFGGVELAQKVMVPVLYVGGPSLCGRLRRNISLAV